MSPVAGWLLVGVLVGVAFSIRMPRQQSSPANRTLPMREQANIATRLEQEQAVLRQGVETRRKTLAEYEKEAASRSAMLAALQKELSTSRTLAGLTEVSGPGIVVTLGDSDRTAKQGENAELLIVHDYDLRDVLNALWAGGAEAVTVNDERVVFTTDVYCVGGTIIVGERRVSPPLSISAIGDRQNLTKILNNDPELTGLRQRAKDKAVIFAYEQRATIKCPPYTGALQQQFSKAGG